MSNSKRTDEDYEIESLTKGLLVLEALKGTRWEPVTIQTVMDRTRYNRDLVTRTLRTLRLRGYANFEKGKWSIGKRAIVIAQSISANQV